MENTINNEMKGDGGQLRLYCDDCLVKLKTLPDNSIDSIVTDPP